MSEDPQRQMDAFSSQLAIQLLQDCETMARHAVANGMALPQWLGNALAKMGGRPAATRRQLAELEAGPLDVAAKATRREALSAELGAAVREDLRGLTRIHSVLAELVAPATPRSLAATENADSFARAMRSIPLIGQMLTVGLLCLAAYIAVLAFPAGAGSWGEVARQAGLLAAAGLGASFYALFTANRYVIARTYDPKYTIVYWTRFGLGLIAGVILANLIVVRTSSSVLRDVGPTTIALLGGYSSDAVNRILRRLVDMLVTLVRGDTREIVAAREHQLKAAMAEQSARERLATASTLLQLYQRLADNAPGEEVRNRLREILDSLLSGQEEPQ
jgi:hypothetical protein